MHSSKPHFILIFLGCIVVPACGGDDKDEKGCNPETEKGCDSGLVCEEVQGKTPACFSPVEIRGRVFDASSSSGISGATVVALDANGGARSSVVRSGADGAYSLALPATRDMNGNPVRESVTLRVAASAYQAFPTPPRTALPIDLSTASGDDPRVVKNTATDVALLRLPGDTSKLGTLMGHIEFATPGGVLVVAIQNGTAVSTAVSDKDGSFTLFNIPAGQTQVEAYRAGINVAPQAVNITSGAAQSVTLVGSSGPLATVQGSVNIVNAPGGSRTSVILVVESTFIMNAARGEAPAGLRAGDVTGAFSIAGVAPGRYVVLAAFENDNLVRDPDQSIGGTDIVHIEVPSSGGVVPVGQSFKVTEALAVTSPGAEGVELLSTTTPTFVWADDSSEDGYELRVFNAFGMLVHENTGVARVTGASTVSYTWTGASLERGMVYQFRAYSWRGKMGGRTYISATEDLRGVFQYQPPP